MTREYETIDGERMVSYQRVVIELNAQVACGAVKKETAIDILEHLPVIKPVSKSEIPNKCGHWKYTGTYDEDGMLECSVCKREVDPSCYHYKFCPMCGAKMEQRKGEE